MKEWLKIFKKLPIGYQKLIAQAIEDILRGQLTHLDVDDMGDGRMRCRIGKYRIIFRRTATGYEVLKLGARGDIYK
jgi:mRNA-degrading endonuclease RelE of RelBE toxin-antitoxin system